MLQRQPYTSTGRSAVRTSVYRHGFYGLAILMAVASGAASLGLVSMPDSLRWGVLGIALILLFLVPGRDGQGSKASGQTESVPREPSESPPTQRENEEALWPVLDRSLDAVEALARGTKRRIGPRDLTRIPPSLAYHIRKDLEEGRDSAPSTDRSTAMPPGYQAR